MVGFATDLLSKGVPASEWLRFWRTRLELSRNYAHWIEARQKSVDEAVIEGVVLNMGTSDLPPNKWRVELAANIGTAEEFVSRMLELSDLVNGTDIFDPQRQKAKEAFASLLMDGLIPSFLELRQIRESVGRTMPAVDRQQLYEDFARKLWKAYKELTQNAVREIGHDIGFLFLPEDKFLEGVAGLQRANPNLREWFGDLLQRARENWQNDLADFRNNWVEHQKGDRRKYDKFYTPQYAEFLFESAWRTIADILPPLLELHFPGGIRLVEQNPKCLGDRWENRFRFTLPQFTQPKEN